MSRMAFAGLVCGAHLIWKDADLLYFAVNFIKSNENREQWLLFFVFFRIHFELFIFICSFGQPKLKPKPASSFMHSFTSFSFELEKAHTQIMCVFCFCFCLHASFRSHRYTHRTNGWICVQCSAHCVAKNWPLIYLLRKSKLLFFCFFLLLCSSSCSLPFLLLEKIMQK